MNEHELIDAIKEWTGERLIGDDCAVLPGQQLVTVDTLVEGTHFDLSFMRLEDVGWKAVAVNLSDVAAMSGRPRFAVVSLTLPEHMKLRHVEQLYAGMLDCARAYRTRIVGGNLSAGQRIVISITLIGDEHEAGTMKRSGAQAGDVVVVSGTFGDSAAGLWLMQSGIKQYEHLKQKHARPLPRLCESWSIVRQAKGRGAMMDASDGLGDALLGLAAASAVGVEVEEKMLAVNQNLRQVADLAGVNWLDWVLYGGEEYELVACLRPDDWQALKQLPNNSFVQIGVVNQNAGVASLRLNNGQIQSIKRERTFQHW